MVKVLKNFKIILWDFDGVLMDSMPVRDEGFKQVLKNYPADQVLQLMDFHKKNGGLSRYVKFRYFFEEIRKETIEENQIQLLAADFSGIMMKLLINAELLINDSMDFVRKHFSTIPMHIVSGSDGRELNEICRQLDIHKYFKSIHGSPVPKNKLVSDLLKEWNYNPNDVVLIGDSINDYEAAKNNKIHFLGYNNPLLLQSSQSYVYSFNEKVV